MTDALQHLSAALAGRYRIEREVGAGGMATVYLAAVLGAERFVQEIKTTAALQHPHILPLYDSGRAGGPAGGAGAEFLFYVMPYIAGETLREKLNRETQLGIARSSTGRRSSGSRRPCASRPRWRTRSTTRIATG